MILSLNCRLKQKDWILIAPINRPEPMFPSTKLFGPNSPIALFISENTDQIESKIKFEIKPLHRKIRTMYLRSKQEVTAQAVEQVENKLSNRFNLIDNRIVTNSKGMLKSQ